jgi:hypothetical protein
MILHHNALCTPCIALLLVSHTAFCDRPHRVELEELMNQAQVEDFTNLDLNQGKSSCIYQCSLSFILNLTLCSILIVR